MVRLRGLTQTQLTLIDKLIQEFIKRSKINAAS